MLLIHRYALIALWFCTLNSLVSAEKNITVKISDTYIRPQQLLQLLVEADASLRSEHYPLRLAYRLSNKNQTIVEQETEIKRWEDFNQGILLHLRTPHAFQHNNVDCVIAISNATNQSIKTLSISKPTTTKLYAQFNTLIKQFPIETQSNFQRLRFEQLALLLKQPLRAADFKVIEFYFKNIQENAKSVENAAVIEGAFSSTADNSVHPYRLYQADKPQGLVVLCRHYQHAPTKAQWNTCEPSIINQALKHQFSCIDMYPAGDILGNGISGLRIADCIKAVLHDQAALKQIPIHYIGFGNGCRSIWQAQSINPLATSLCFHPESKQIGALLLSDSNQEQAPIIAEAYTGFTRNIPSVLSALNKHRSIENQDRLNGLDLGEADKKRFWQWLSKRTPLNKADHRNTRPLTSPVGSRPLICVIGAGEHLAAKQHIADIVRSLKGSWAIHAQAHLPTVEASDFQPAEFSSHDILFIGNPLDNQALIQHFKQHPESSRDLRWDARSIHHDSSQHLRSKILSITWRLPHEQRNIWVLSGPGLRFPIGPLPLQNTSSRLILDDGKTVWSAE